MLNGYSVSCVLWKKEKKDKEIGKRRKPSETAAAKGFELLFFASFACRIVCWLDMAGNRGILQTPPTLHAQGNLSCLHIARHKELSVGSLCEFRSLSTDARGMSGLFRQ